MAKAKEGDTVRVDYTGRFEDGSVFDSSSERGPMEFTIGSGQVISGFEKAVVGMQSGETKTALVDAGDAYGEHREDLMLVVDRGKLPENLEPEVGEHLELRQSDGKAILVRVAEVTETSVTLDANHPLAGRNLIFDIMLAEIV